MARSVPHEETPGKSGQLGRGLRERRLRRKVAQGELAARLRMSAATFRGSSTEPTSGSRRCWSSRAS